MSWRCFGSLKSGANLHFQPNEAMSAMETCSGWLTDLIDKSHSLSTVAIICTQISAFNSHKYVSVKYLTSLYVKLIHSWMTSRAAKKHAHVTGYQQTLNPLVLFPFWEVFTWVFLAHKTDFLLIKSSFISQTLQNQKRRPCYIQNHRTNWGQI